MSTLAAVAIYRPCYESEGLRVPGPDEDVVTMAVAAARPLLAGGRVAGVVVVHGGDAAPEVAPAVIATALGMAGEVPVEVVAAGAATLAERLARATAGELVVAVQTGLDRAGAGAALVAEGQGLILAGRARAALPVAAALRAQDPRLARERAWRPLLEELGGGRPFRAAGLPPAAARALGAESEAALGGPAGVIEHLAAMIEVDRPGRLVAVEGGSAVAVDLTELGARVCREARRATVALPEAVAHGEIPISLSGYDRAFPARVGLKAARCECGELSLPPRSHCLNCGRDGATTLVDLPRRARVYSVVTIHAPIPGRRVPYSLAVVDFEGERLRLLAPVTDAQPGGTPIDHPGGLVLRRLADREGVADYGYAFQPDEHTQDGHRV